jgi:hypothetical protein
MSLIPFAPFFTADFLAPFFALLFPSRPRRLVIGDVLLHGRARNSAPASALTEQNSVAISSVRGKKIGV